MAKSADEMFRELGYTVATDTGTHRRYEKHIYANKLTIDFWITSSGCAFISEVNGMFTLFSGQEILACAQLIKEMEGGNA